MRTPRRSRNRLALPRFSTSGPDGTDMQAAMKTVLFLAALVEGATGALLLTFPSIVLRMLFGAEVTGAGEVTGRIAGMALIGLAVACWPDGSIRSALRGMLTYSLLALLFLVYLGVRGASVGVLLWPAVVVHAILIAMLLRARFTERAGPAGGRDE